MKSIDRMPTAKNWDGGFYRAFLRLDRDRRRSVALRILREKRVLPDLYDHFLIQEARREPGRKTC